MLNKKMTTILKKITESPIPEIIFGLCLYFIFDFTIRTTDLIPNTPSTVLGLWVIVIYVPILLYWYKTKK